MMFIKSGKGLKSNTDLPTEVKDVVKGTAKRIIVVKSPDKRVFEEAIFIVREEYLNSAGITQAELLKEARTAARCYVGNIRTKGALSRTTVISAVSAVAGSGLSFLIFKILGI